MGNQSENSEVEVFRNKCKPYFDDKLPLFKHPSGILDGNAVLYTMHFFQILIYHDAITEEDTRLFKEVVRLCTIEPGFLHRGPHKIMDRQAHDDNVGAASVAQALIPIIGKTFYDYGRTHGYFYLHPKKYDPKSLARAFWLRLPGVIPHFKVCAGLDLNVYDEYAIVIDYLWTSLQGVNYTSGRLLDWHKIESYRRSPKQYDRVTQAVDNWGADIARRYPESLLGGIFKRYFPGDPNYPFTVMMWGKNITKGPKPWELKRKN